MRLDWGVCGISFWTEDFLIDNYSMGGNMWGGNKFSTLKFCDNYLCKYKFGRLHYMADVSAIKRDLGAPPIQITILYKLKGLPQSFGTILQILISHTTSNHIVCRKIHQ
jgi:hypothetical protein